VWILPEHPDHWICLKVCKVLTLVTKWWKPFSRTKDHFAQLARVNATATFPFALYSVAVAEHVPSDLITVVVSAEMWSTTCKHHTCVLCRALQGSSGLSKLKISTDIRKPQSFCSCNLMIGLPKIPSCEIAQEWRNFILSVMQDN